MPTPILSLPYPSSADTADVPRDIKALADAVDPLGVVPTGALMLWPTDVAPTGWLLCNGGQVNAATYPKLAAVLGSAAGVITLPDFTDRFPVGTGASAVLGAGGANAVALATNQLPVHNHVVTDPTHTHTEQAAGYHGHSLNIAGANVVDPAHVFPVAGGVVPTWPAAGPYQQVGGQHLPASTADSWHGEVGSHGHDGSTAIADGQHSHVVNPIGSGISIQNTGAGATHENRPAFRAINFIIRAV